MIVGWTRYLIAALMLLLGGIWVGQGLGVIRGSFMTGSPFWGTVGVLVIAGAVWLVVRRPKQS